MRILDEYSTSFPTAQSALDIFRGEWSSKLPEELGQTEAGSCDLFSDPRVLWGMERLGGVKGKLILELGPLEGGHTYLLDQLGAEVVYAVEANKRAFLKCLIVKELLRLRSARFLHGDCLAYLRECDTKFDVCLASGILYHMLNPVELISLLAKSTDRLFIWTHYYDPACMQADHLKSRFSAGRAASWEAFEHTLFRYRYKAALDWDGFCGGGHQEANWLSREDILACLAHFGFDKVEVGYELHEHPNGPCFCLAATKQNPTRSDRLHRAEAQVAETRRELDHARRRIADLEGSPKRPGLWSLFRRSAR